MLFLLKASYVFLIDSIEINQNVKEKEKKEKKAGGKCMEWWDEKDGG